MHHGSINFSCVLIWVLKLKSDHLDPQSTMDSHPCPLTKKVIIWVLQLMQCLSKGLNPTASHFYAYVPTWMKPGKTCRKSPPPLLRVYSLLYSCRSHARLVAAHVCLPALEAHTQRSMEQTKRGGLHETEGVARREKKRWRFFFFCNFNRRDHVGSWCWRGGFCISCQG